MAEYGEVKFKVRRNALLLREFTISELVRATGLNPESVRTEVQRMKQEELLFPETESRQRETIYRLSDDPKKRLALSRSVEAFYPKSPKPFMPRPTSRLYKAAVISLNQVDKKKGKQREELLNQAEHQLEGAWEAEGASRAPKLVQAHILRERGRLAYLRAKWESAKELFELALEIFAEGNLDGETRLVDEYLLCIEAQHRIHIAHTSDVATQARCVLDILNTAEHVSPSPLIHLLGDLTRELSLTSKARVAETTLEIETSRKIDETHEEVKGIREDLRRLIQGQEPQTDLSQELFRIPEIDRQENATFSSIPNRDLNKVKTYPN